MRYDALARFTEHQLHAGARAPVRVEHAVSLRHAYPAVPLHALPRLHEQVRSWLEHVEPGYMAATVEVNRHLFGRGPGILRHPG
jgi:hypothetical protein